MTTPNSASDAQPALPTSTYRLQLHSEFTLFDAAAVVPYLAGLGVGAVYLSPVLTSTTGSTHGYDTTDPRRIDPARGGQAGWDALHAAAAKHGLEVVVDIVPNHLGIEIPPENPAWWDLLTHGRDSAYASWFDIDWSRPRLIVPVLGDDQTLKLADGELHYFEHRFPLAPGTWSPGDDPDEVHARQHYELVHYSRGNTDLNYRRFFAITTLAGVRVEDESVFAATHALIGDWVEAGLVAGLRIDHPDGLVDPKQYLERLRALAPQAWITVEKILEPGEELPADWPVQGTTGYDSMREVNGLFVDPAAELELTALYRDLTADEHGFTDHVEIGKRMAVTTLLPAEVRRMAALVPDVPDAGRALAEVAVAFDVYRSYLPVGADRLDHAVALAAERNPELSQTLDALSPRLHDPADELARRLQQLSGATMAKGVEDTAYYRYSRFIALNEVGGNPDDFGVDLGEFHALQAARRDRQASSMTGLSTHDTKRGEDVRARLAVLSEIPHEWTNFARAFRDASSTPNLAMRYFIAQTLVGAGPVERERIHAYVEKAMREASDGTSWTQVDNDFEARAHDDVDRAYDDPSLRDGWDRILALVEQPGWSNALGQKLIQLTMPGIPDVYQGTELWDDSLVDPDNRRPVDYAERRQILRRVIDRRPRVDASGAAKLWVVRQALHLRRNRPRLFSGYSPVVAEGPAADHLAGFDRGGVISLVTRLPVNLAEAGGWRDTALALSGTYVDALSGERWTGRTKLVQIFGHLPVALLVRR